MSALKVSVVFLLLMFINTDLTLANQAAMHKFKKVSQPFSLATWNVLAKTIGQAKTYLECGVICIHLVGFMLCQRALYLQDTTLLQCSDETEQQIAVHYIEQQCKVARLTYMMTVPTDQASPDFWIFADSNLPTICDTGVLSTINHNGQWLCMVDHQFRTTCYLECGAGYVSLSKSATTCLNNVWTPPLSEFTCVEGVALLTGGFINQKLVEVYGPGVHKKLSDLPSNQVGHSVDYVDGCLLLCGGRGTGTSGTTCVKGQYISSTKDIIWSNHSTLVEASNYPTSEVILGHLHLFEGPNNDKVEKTSQVYDNENEIWKRGVQLATMTSEVYAIKVSSTEIALLHQNALHLYDMMSYRYTTLANYSKTVETFSCTYINDMASGLKGILVAGAYGTSDTFLINLKTQASSSVGRLNVQRKAASKRLVVMRGYVYILGGYNTDTVERLDLTLKMWSLMDETLLDKRYDHATTLVPRQWFVDP